MIVLRWWRYPPQCVSATPRVCAASSSSTSKPRMLAWIEPASDLASLSVWAWTKRPILKPTSLSTMMAMKGTTTMATLL